MSGNPILQYRESRFPPLRNARVAGVHFLIPVPVRVPAAMGQATNSVRRHLLCLAFVGRQCKPPLAGPNGRIGQTPPYRTYRMCARVRADGPIRTCGENTREIPEKRSLACALYVL